MHSTARRRVVHRLGPHSLGRRQGDELLLVGSRTVMGATLGATLAAIERYAPQCECHPSAMSGQVRPRAGFPLKFQECRGERTARPHGRDPGRRHPRGSGRRPRIRASRSGCSTRVIPGARGPGPANSLAGPRGNGAQPIVADGTRGRNRPDRRRRKVRPRRRATGTKAGRWRGCAKWRGLLAPSMRNERRYCGE